VVSARARQAQNPLLTKLGADYLACRFEQQAGESMNECKNCNGTGYVLSFNEGDQDWEEVLCENCLGSGLDDGDGENS